MANVPMEMAVEGDAISLDSLAAAINFCNEQAKALNSEFKAGVKAGLPAAELHLIGDLRDEYQIAALELSAKSIKLVAGEAKITAEHIASAVAAAESTIASIEQFKDRLAKLSAVLTFFGTLLTGNGREIVKGAKALKDALQS